MAVRAIYANLAGNKRQTSSFVIRAGSIPFNPSPEGSAFLARIKGFLFYSFTLLLSVPLFFSMLAMTPFVLLFDNYRCVICCKHKLKCLPIQSFCHHPL